MTNHAKPLDRDRSYQIFEREAVNTTLCIEVVKGFDEARSRIEQAPAASPDSELFIVDPLPGKTIDQFRLRHPTYWPHSRKAKLVLSRVRHSKLAVCSLFLTHSRDLAP